MGLTLRIHVVAAGLGLIFGWVALAASKGETVHRKSGILFVYAMVTMSLAGAAMAAFKGEAGNVIAGLLTAYLVTTALLTVRPATAGVRRTEVGAMLMALALALTIVTLAFQALASPSGTRFGIPFGIYFMFGTVAVLACIGDVRMIRSGGLRGRPRLARHLWRMCYALFIATASFFLGPRARVARVLPEQLLHPGLLALPVLAVLVLMFYWLWRVRSRRPFRGLVGLHTAEAS
jgi:uncharacterized membrane protein